MYVLIVRRRGAHETRHRRAIQSVEHYIAEKEAYTYVFVDALGSHP